MIRIIPLALALLMLLAVAGCVRGKDSCLKMQQRAQEVASQADRSLRPGMTPEEVRSALGEPDSLIIHKGPHEAQTWKYMVSPGCTSVLGLSAPITQLSFLGCILHRWEVSGK